MQGQTFANVTLLFDNHT